MWRNKKVIIIAALTALVLAGSIGGVVMAQTEDNDHGREAQHEALMEQVCAIYEENTGNAIDAEALQEAFAEVRDGMLQARDGMHQPGDGMQIEARENILQNLVDEGRITQEEADQYKAWLEAKPDINLPIGPGQGGPGMGRGSDCPGGRFHDRDETSTTE
jgi:hypothetical protein